MVDNYIMRVIAMKLSRLAVHPTNLEKCENSAKNRPDYVKITPQNSTDYVKSLCKNNRICDLQIANPYIISPKKQGEK